MMPAMLRRLLLVSALVGALVVALVLTAVPALAQDGTGEFEQFTPVIAWLVGAIVAFGPGARGVTWVVDRVRDAVPFGDDRGKKILWPLLALVIALFGCVGFGINVIGGLFTAIPRFAESNALNGLAGEILTAIGMAGFASSWHDRDKAKNPPTFTLDSTS